MSATANSGGTANLKPWPKGISGNPSGRPKANAALRAKCRELDDEMIERLRSIAMVADTDAASVAAIKLLLAYGHGAPESKPIDEETEDADAVPSADEAAEAARRLRERTH